MKDNNKKMVENMLSKNQEIERSIIKKYRKQIWGKFVQAVQEF